MFDFLPAALNFIGGMEQRSSQESMFERGQAFNAEEAQKNRNWQEQMSNSAYQRAMADMKAANLNPMLAFMKGGASTPGGSQASGPSAPALENLAAGAVSSGLQARRVEAEIGKLNADTDLAEAQAANERYSPSDNLEDEDGNVRLPTAKVSAVMADTEAKLATAGHTREQIRLVEPTIRKILNEVASIAQGTQETVVRTRKIIDEHVNVLAERGLIRAHEKEALANTILRQLEAKTEREKARFSEATGILGPAINSASKAASIPFQLRPRISIRR